MQAAEVLHPTVSSATQAIEPAFAPGNRSSAEAAVDDPVEERPSLSLIVGGRTFRDELARVLPSLQPRALGLCRNQSDASDLLSDTAERALRFESHFVVGSNMRAWLNQILFSVFVTRCRRRRRESLALEMLKDDPCAWFQTDNPAVMQSFSPRLRAALDRLPAVFAETVALVDIGELAYKEAAQELGVPVGTIMSRLHRGRKLLATMLSH